ncbi:MAG: carboxypeptidase-like regulatory domain-containing protein [Acidobacteriia bacterium]|nr:carboxypeptidase-like regulatory domain-containing protein [Terriglobia bacterium]
MRTLKPFLIGWALLAAFAVLWAQGGRGRGNQGQAQTGQPGQAGQPGQGTPAVTLPPGSVEGRVLSITGEVLRKVTLTLRPNGRGGGSYGTTSANDGSFRFPSVDQGTYMLTGERTGYVRETLSTPSGQTLPIEVVSEKNTSGIELKMTPQSVIAGHVFDEDGDPVQSVNVEVWRYTYPRGRKQITQVQNGTTNDLGEFRIANLAPGRYFVSATARRGALQAILNGGGRGGRGGGPGGRQAAGGGRVGPVETIEDYVTTYYPNLTEATNASPLNLVAGSEVRGIDIRLLKARYHRVSGSVAGLPAAGSGADDAKAKGKGKAGDGGFALAGPGIMLSLTPRNGEGGRQLAGAQVFADGSFEFPAVPPGSYYINAQTPGAVQQRLTARVPVDVGNGDINNVSLRLQPPLSLSGVLTVDSTQPNVRLGSLRLTFTPSEPGPGGQGRNGQAQLADDGTFQATLAADAYLIEAGGMPDGYYLKSVKLAGREMPDATLDLNYGGGQVQVVLAPTAGDITGTVQNSHGDPAASVQVTAVPTSGSLRKDMNKLVTTDAMGNFTLHGLPPGEYKIFAWEEVETNAWMDHDYRQPFETQSVSAKVDASTTPTVQLKLIERGAR